MKRWVLIALGTALAAVVLIVAIVLVGTRGEILTGGVPRGDVDFAAGPHPVIPAYPGGSQLTGKVEVDVPDDMKRVLGSLSGWRLYETSDDPDAVYDFYNNALADTNLNRAGERESGISLWTRDSDRYAVYAYDSSGETRVVIGEGEE